MREKQMLQIQGFIQNDFKGQLISKENSEKLTLMKKIEEDIDKDISLKMKIQKFEKNQRDIFKERILLTEFEVNQRKLDEKEFEKQRKIQEKIIEEKLKIKEKLDKQNEKRKNKEEQLLNNERLLLEEKLRKEYQKKRYEEKVNNKL
jgi:hypothetical protein